MYECRQMTPEQRRRLVAARRRAHLPWHSPPHWDQEGERQYLVSAACFEHVAVIGKDPERIAECEEELLEACRVHATGISAWCVLPNHYHVLLQTSQLKTLVASLGRFHGRSSRRWNRQDGRLGRQVWYRCTDRGMRSEGHFWASLNYVHHNPVLHGYVKRWEDWPFSSATRYLELVGRDKAEAIWRQYPILGYGKDWDVC